jgi:arabinose-5-phosphate isomerase
MEESKDILKIGRDTILLESESLNKLSTLLDVHFSDVVSEIVASKGRVVVTGIGKSAIIGQKMVATFNSTGTPALFMHAADAIHGDLGMIQDQDIVICISKSGNSPEIIALVPLISNAGNKLVGMTGNLESFLAKNCDFLLDTTVDAEACPNNLAPTTSTVAQMAMGDALAVALIKCRNFKSEDFAKYHPGGALGKKLYLTLGEIASKNTLPVVDQEDNLPTCILAMTEGRMGAVLVLDKSKIVGIITDGDLRRMLNRESDMAANVLRGKHFKAKEIMTPQPKTMLSDDLAINGVNFLKKNKINHIVLSDGDRPIGMVHIQDLIREGVL